MTTVDQLIESLGFSESDMTYLNAKYVSAWTASRGKEAFDLSFRMDDILNEREFLMNEIPRALDQQLTDYFESTSEFKDWGNNGKAISSSILKNRLDIDNYSLEQALSSLEVVDSQLESYYEFGNRPGPILLEMFSNHLNQRITMLLDSNLNSLDKLQQKFKELSNLKTQALFIATPLTFIQEAHLDYINTRTGQLKEQINSILDKQLEVYFKPGEIWDKKASSSLLRMKLSCPPLPPSDDEHPKPFPILPFIFALVTAIPFLLVLNS